MRTSATAIGAAVALTGSAFAQQSLENYTQIESPRIFDVRTGQWTSQSVFTDRGATETIYSSVMNPTAQGQQHDVVGEVIGDDLTPSFSGLSAGQVQEVTISIANFGVNIVDQALSLDVIFFRDDGDGAGNATTAGTEIGTINLNLPNFNLGQSQFGLFTFTNLNSGVNLFDERFWIGVRFNSLGGGDATQLGQVFFSGQQIGSSSGTEWFRDSEGTNPQFSGTASNSFGYEVVVPAPGAVALFGLGGLAAVTRRRRA